MTTIEEQTLAAVLNEKTPFVVKKTNFSSTFFSLIVILFKMFIQIKNLVHRFLYYSIK